MDTIESELEVLLPRSQWLREAACKAAGRTCQVKVYADAPHGFNADYRPSYRPDDAKDGWAKILAWFKEHGAA